jgi:ABC-type spermidine/putrescine transport system permease subunit I
MRLRRGDGIVERGVLGAPFLLCALMILGPLAATLVVSFWRKSGFSMQPDLVLENYAALVSGTRLEVLLESLFVAATATPMMLVIAFPIAFFVARRVRASAVRPVLFLFAAPFLVNYILRTFAWADILSRTGPVNEALIAMGLVSRPVDWLLYSDFAVYLGLVTAYMPFMIFPIWLSLSGIDAKLEEASWMSGESPSQTFRRVILPLSAPGVFAAAIFGFVGAFGEVAVSLILGGTGYQLLGNAIQSALDVLNYPLAAAISSASTLLMLALLFAWGAAFDLRILLGKIVGRE